MTVRHLPETPISPDTMIHGGDLTDAIARTGIPLDSWLDMSTGINPIPYPFSAPAATDWTRLPARADLDKLLEAAETAYRVPKALKVVAAPGTQSLIQRLPDLAPGGGVAVVGPTYGPHVNTWRQAGRPVTLIAEPDEVPESASVLVVTNPNNPDGRVFSLDQLHRASGSIARRGGLLVVDEAFADVDPEVSVIPTLSEASPVVVLRSFGKFFGLAGLRLGFAVTNPVLARRIGDALGEWAIAGPALRVGIEALNDATWQNETRTSITGDMAALCSVLERVHLPCVGDAGLFCLIRAHDAGRLHARLADAGIWTRIFDYDPTWLRLGLPGSTSALERFERALTGQRD